MLVTFVEAHMETASVLTAAIRQKYGRAALGSRSGCCGGGGCDPITSNLYQDTQTEGLPAEAVRASLGCGNPTALADLRPGQTVLDLGSGGGIDVLLSARRVAPGGWAFGLDMTEEMLSLAEENKRKSGLQNVTFLRGEIENIPLPDNSVDLIISNCVINLSGDKDRVLHEAFRVLRPGGAFAVSDVVVRGDVPAAVRESLELWVGCIAGALRDRDYVDKLTSSGFTNVTLEDTRVYGLEEARAFLAAQGLADRLAQEVNGTFVSAFIRAIKPPVTACCGTDCCA